MYIKEGEAWKTLKIIQKRNLVMLSNPFGDVDKACFV